MALAPLDNGHLAGTVPRHAPRHSLAVAGLASIVASIVGPGIVGEPGSRVLGPAGLLLIALGLIRIGTSSHGAPKPMTGLDILARSTLVTAAVVAIAAVISGGNPLVVGIVAVAGGASAVWLWFVVASSKALGRRLADSELGPDPSPFRHAGR